MPIPRGTCPWNQSATGESMTGHQSPDDILDEYSRHTGRRFLFLAALAVAVAVLFLVSVTVGTRGLSVAEVFGLLIDHLSGVTYDRATEYGLWFDDNIVWQHRTLPVTMEYAPVAPDTTLSDRRIGVLLLPLFASFLVRYGRTLFPQ